MKKLGNELRRIRESKNILLRQVAYVLDIDTALMSKIERGERNIQREQVKKIAAFYKISDEELLTLWVHDKVLNVVENEPFAVKGMQKALKSLKV